MSDGRCNCGAVAFETETELSDVYVCHCSICRRATGSQGIAIVLVDKADFRWTRGEDHISHWTKPDGDWSLSFCQVCGSPLPGENDAKHMFIPAGLISHGSDLLETAAHIWVDSKACWHEIGGRAPQYKTVFGGDTASR